jgi:hypothetical protein
MIASASPCGQVNFRAPWNAENRWLRQAFHNRKHWMHLGSKEGGPQASAVERPVPHEKMVPFAINTETAPATNSSTCG